MGLRVSTLIGRLLHMSWNAQVNVSSSSSVSDGDQVVDTQLKKRERRKKKDVLRAEREDRDLFLPDEILEDIFLRLPFFDLHSVEGVCKTWKRLIASQSFRRSYKSTLTLVEAKPPWKRDSTRYEWVRDSSKKALKFRWSIRSSHDTVIMKRIHRAITSRINGLVFAVTLNSLGERIYVCDMFANTWVEVPLRHFSVITDETAIFYLGGGQYKLVYWWRSAIFTQTFGRKKQENSRSDYLHRCYTNPVMIGSSMFFVGCARGDINFLLGDERLSLMEYNHEADKLQFTQITGTPGKEFDLYNRARGDKLYLTVWQDKLYLLKQYLLNAEVDVWQISTADGCATFLHRFRMKRQAESFDVFDIDEEGVLHLEGSYVKNNGDFSLSFDMVGIGKCMRKISVTNTHTISRHTLLPVRLSNVS